MARKISRKSTEKTTAFWTGVAVALLFWSVWLWA